MGALSDETGRRSGWISGRRIAPRTFQDRDAALVANSSDLKGRRRHLGAHLALHVAHPRTRRTLPQPTAQGADGVGRAARKHFHPAVAQIARIPGHSQRERLFTR
jgi:hypothetical protein